MLENQDSDRETVPNFLWKGISPHKVEILAWQIWKGKVLVKKVLQRHGMSQISDLSCPFCKEDDESIDHLFLQCSWSNSLWECGLSWWGVQGCVSGNMNGWMEGWMGLCPNFRNERAWVSLLYATLWTIWESRNQLVFEGKDPCKEKAKDLIKFRIVWWFKHLGRGSMESVDALFRNLSALCVDNKKMKRKNIVDWIPPLQDSLKFNVDGSSKGNPGAAGMGGVLRDSNGKILCLFSSFLGVRDSNAAEIMAIKKAVELCNSNSSLQNRDITVVSDSKVAVSWANSKDFGNINHVNAVYAIRSELSKRAGLKVVFDARIFNSFADSLAKMGADERGDFTIWSDS